MTYNKSVFCHTVKFLVLRKFLLRFWLFFIFIVVFSWTFFYGIGNWDLLGELPSTQQLENPKFFQASEIYSADGKLIGTYYTENRINVEYKDIPSSLVNALIATEDKRFYNHSGVDFQGVGRAVAGVFVGGKGGGSTITQQLAKMLFTNTGQHGVIVRVTQKLKEWVMATRIESLYTKEEILTMYFNQFDFLHSAVGVYNASRVYFGKNLKDLTIEECATLVSMFKSPVRYNPMKHSEENHRCINRRNTVMKLMQNADFISQAEFDSLKIIPLKVAEMDISGGSEYAAYFRENIRGFMKKWAKKNDYNLYTDGLKIYTSIDSKMQKAAEKAMIRHLQKELQPVFEREWKNRKNGPFDFLTGNAEQEKKKLKDILYVAMRRSGRYTNTYYKRKYLLKSYDEYKKLKVPYTVIKDSLSKYKDVLHEVEFDLKLLKRKDTLKYFEKDLLDIYQEKFDDVLSKYEDYQEEAGDLKEEANEAYEVYQELLKPFDDSMKIVFNKKVKMDIFSWKKGRTITKTMSPLDSIYYHKKFLRAGMLSVDATTGYVKSWVGGINYKHFKYDHIHAKRQVGSAFKPFVYAAAIEHGMDPSTVIMNKEVTFHKGEYGIPESWTPANSGAKNLEYELITLKTGLAKSINWIAAGLTKKLGVYTAVEFAKRFGLKGTIQPVPSICLGTADVSLWEMVGAYTAFTNKGERFEPVTLLRIEDKNGKVLFETTPKKFKVLSESTASQMLELMEGNTTRFKDNGKTIQGTGYRLRTNKPYGGFANSVKISGKTGTTQNSSDGWYMGITNNIVTGVWVGCEDRSAHFRNGALGQGANMALPVWGYYMKEVLAILKN